MSEHERGMVPERKPALAMLATGAAIGGLLAWLSRIVTRPDQAGRDGP
jgi:hypothetical protein